MSAIADLTENEKYLLAILQDQSGVDAAEFLWRDETAPDFVFRCWDFQVPWYRCNDKFQIDQCGRALGKSVGMAMRAWAFCFTNPGEEMLLTAPELIHLDPVTQSVERRITDVRLSREFLKTGAGVTGFTHRPFRAQFRNGARIVGRIPQKDGKGVKGSISCTVGSSNSNTVTPMTDDSTMILTDTGLRPASELSIGDMVFTHMGRFRPIEHIYRYEAEALEVSGAGHRGMLVSTNHRFYARRNSNPQRTRNLSNPTWVVADDPEITRWYWASPTTFPGAEIALSDFPTPSRPLHWNDNGVDRTEVLESPLDEHSLVMLMSLVGRYLADGYMSMRPKADGTERPTYVGFVDDEKGILEIESLAQLLGYRATRKNHSNAFCTTISNTLLCDWLLNEFGRLSDGKRIPGWVLGLPQDHKRALLDGYLAGDGHWNQDRARWEFGTASKQLALGLKLLAQSLGYQTSFSWVDPKVKAIAGTDLKTVPKRSYRVQLMESGHGIIEDGFLWGKIRKVTPAGVREVMDIVVAEDYSFVGDGIVHKGSRFLPEDDEVI